VANEARPAVRKLLSLAIGAIAAAGLLTSVPADESGRKVEIAVQPDGEAVVRHVRGPEFLTAYRDIVGVWTICDGITAGVRSGTRETREGCLRRLEDELVQVAEHMLECVPTLREPGRDYQRWAIVSLAYNAGWPSICRSTAARRFNARDWRGGCDAFLMWNKAGRPLREVRGLTLRRQREREICMTGAPGFPASTLEARLEKFR